MTSTMTRGVSRTAITVVVTLSFAAVGLPQSGRKLKIVKTPPPPDATTTTENSNAVKSSQDMAENKEIFRCTGNDNLVRVDDPSDEGEVFTTKTVDVKAYIDSKPKAAYTHEARRGGVQGTVILRMVLLSTGEIGTIRIIRGLPAGLTENAIRAACRLKFRPAIKDKKEVSQSIQIEYSFRLMDRR